MSIPVQSTQLSIHWTPCALPWRKEQLGCHTKFSLPPSAKLIRIGGGIPPLPHMPSRQVQEQLHLYLWYSKGRFYIIREYITAVGRCKLSEFVMRKVTLLIQSVGSDHGQQQWWVREWLSDCSRGVRLWRSWSWVTVTKELCTLTHRLYRVLLELKFHTALIQWCPWRWSWVTLTRTTGACTLTKKLHSMFRHSSATQPGSPTVPEDNYDYSRSDMLLCSNMIKLDHPRQNWNSKTTCKWKKLENLKLTELYLFQQ